MLKLNGPYPSNRGLGGTTDFTNRWDRVCVMSFSQLIVYTLKYNYKIETCSKIKYREFQIDATFTRLHIYAMLEDRTVKYFCITLDFISQRR